MAFNYNEKIINGLTKAIEQDEYIDAVQKLGDKYVFPTQLLNFIKNNTDDINGNILEVGCGCGASFEHFKITHAVEPNDIRRQMADEKIVKEKLDIELKAGFAEKLPFDPETMDAVIMINGFFQTRSDLETMCEFNRVLKEEGRVIINTYDDTNDIVFGRVYGPKNLIRMFNDFGFETVEFRETKIEVGFSESRFIKPYFMYLYCFKKVRKFHFFELRKLQLVKTGDGLYSARNYFPETRDWRLV